MNLLFQKIEELLSEKSQVICAIDGGAATGKTCLAALLQTKYSCNVISMDDFFLRPEQRTSERLAEIGGNIDYERFFVEVLVPLVHRRDFSYEPYDCFLEKFSSIRKISQKPLTIVEGVYSLHPKFSDIYDLKIFLKTAEMEQKKRLVQRNEKLYPRFVKEWIPMEQHYFNQFEIELSCDLILNTEREGLIV